LNKQESHATPWIQPRDYAVILSGIKVYSGIARSSLRQHGFCI